MPEPSLSRTPVRLHFPPARRTVSPTPGAAAAASGAGAAPTSPGGFRLKIGFSSQVRRMQVAQSDRKQKLALLLPYLERKLASALHIWHRFSKTATYRLESSKRDVLLSRRVETAMRKSKDRRSPTPKDEDEPRPFRRSPAKLDDDRRAEAKDSPIREPRPVAPAKDGGGPTSGADWKMAKAERFRRRSALSHLALAFGAWAYRFDERRCVGAVAASSRPPTPHTTPPPNTTGGCAPKPSKSRSSVETWPERCSGASSRASRTASSTRRGASGWATSLACARSGARPRGKRSGHSSVSPTTPGTLV